MKHSNEISKLLSLVLRHSPERLDLNMSDDGWVSVEDLIQKANDRGHFVTRSDIENVVENSEKKRFELDDSGFEIRALQGHSVDVTIDFAEVMPPNLLYHGTVHRFLAGIQIDGLKKMRRLYVHLSSTVDIAHVVGSRRGTPVILTVNAGEMHANGFKFFIAKNGVWLVDCVPFQYIEVQGS